MLTPRLQIQAVADRLAGRLVDTPHRHFQEPWRTCLDALKDKDDPKSARQALEDALKNHPERASIIEKIFSAIPGYSMHFDSLAELKDQLTPIRFLWPGWLPVGMLTLMGAAPGTGKSFLAADLAWRITTDQGFPDGCPTPSGGANVVYVDAEAVPQILNERAQNYGMDLNRLFLLLPDPGEILDFGQEKYRHRLIEMVAGLRPALVILDSLSSLHSRGQNNVEDVRELLSFLAQLAQVYETAMLLIHHIRKPGNGQSIQAYDLSMSDLSGSGHIVAMARVVLGLHIIQTGPQADPNGPRMLKMLKTNLGPYPVSLGFAFAPLAPVGVFLKWMEESPNSYHIPTKVDECAAWLLDLLAHGPIRPADAGDAGEAEGFSRNLIYRARRTLEGSIENTVGKNAPNNLWRLVSAKLSHGA